jgi:hypothetical protein
MTLEDRKNDLLKQKVQLEGTLHATLGAIQMLDILIAERDTVVEPTPPELVEAV